MNSGRGKAVGQVLCALVPRRYYPSMSPYSLPEISKPPRVGKRQVLLVANGDLRGAANRVCWPEQAKMERALGGALAGHGFKADQGHGFIQSKKEGMTVFANVDRSAPIIVAECVWQYSHHILAGLISHNGP